MSAELREEVKLIVDLTLAKVEILKLKADDYAWQCHVDEETKKQLLDTLDEINLMLIALRAKVPAIPSQAETHDS